MADFNSSLAVVLLAYVATGFGLSVSYDIIRDHGGNNEAVSEPGLGITFAIRLTVSRASHDEADYSAKKKL